jgi:hypothetical protein
MESGGHLLTEGYTGTLFLEELQTELVNPYMGMFLLLGVFNCQNK